MLDITHQFVNRWAGEYNARFESGDTTKQEMEFEVRRFLAEQIDQKSLDRAHFLLLGEWKTARQRQNYRKNNDTQIKQATAAAFEEPNELRKLDLVKALTGVGNAVGGTVLHFLHPDQIAIFDVQCRSALGRAGLWSRNVKDDSPEAWLEYVKMMRDLGHGLGVTLRDLDKAL